MTTLDLDDGEKAALVALLTAEIENTRFPLSPRVKVAIIASCLSFFQCVAARGEYRRQRIGAPAVSLSYIQYGNGIHIDWGSLYHIWFYI